MPFELAASIADKEEAGKDTQNEWAHWEAENHLKLSHQLCTLIIIIIIIIIIIHLICNALFSHDHYPMCQCALQSYGNKHLNLIWMSIFVIWILTQGRRNTEKYLNDQPQHLSVRQDSLNVYMCVVCFTTAKSHTNGLVWKTFFSVLLFHNTNICPICRYCSAIYQADILSIYTVYIYQFWYFFIH